MWKKASTGAFLLFVLFSIKNSFAANATVPGVSTSPYPTIHNLAIDWPISGDDNLNGTVQVSYRVQGQPTYIPAMSLRRIPAGTNEGFSWINRFSGSILDLQPATTYDIQLALTDPDGGSTTQNITATTRPIPKAADDSTTVGVTPATFDDIADDAGPGQIMLLEDGVYSGFTFTKNGSLTRPIVIRAVNLGAVVIDGDVRLDGRSYVFLEGLTVNGQIKFNGATGLAIRRCTVNADIDGIVSKTASQNIYVSDNTVIGKSNWTNESVGADGDNIGEGIQLTGPGHVICYNTVRNFRDCISTLEDTGAVNQVCIDIYNNDILVGADLSLIHI